LSGRKLRAGCGQSEFLGSSFAGLKIETWGTQFSVVEEAFK